MRRKFKEAVVIHSIYLGGLGKTHFDNQNGLGVGIDPEGAAVCPSCSRASRRTSLSQNVNVLLGSVDRCDPSLECSDFGGDKHDTSTPPTPTPGQAAAYLDASATI